MNNETVTLIDRPYQEIVDDILTAMVGGVVNEPIFFDLKEDRYPLAQLASDVRSITGTRTVTLNGQLTPVHQSFQKQVDFVFSQADNAVVWQPGGAKPDDETIFSVDYFRPDSRSPLSDINIGSVTRTLGEAIGREIATVYQQINQAYLSAFLDTATGQSLDLVVAILGITRQTKEFATGLVTFFRDLAAGDGNISIPEGTVLSTDKGEATFVSTEMHTLQRGQVRIDVPVRASDASKGKAGIRQAGEITKLSQPITGIARVTNFEATVLGAEDETDQQLRDRARAALRGLGKATLAALANVIFAGRAKLIEVFDPNSTSQPAAAGTVTLLVESEPERFLSLRDAVEQTRAAGVLSTLIARYVFFKPRLVATIAPGIAAAGKDKLVGQIIAALQQYVDGLGAGDPAKGQEMVNAIAKGVKELSDPKNIQIVDVMAWRSDIGSPGAESLTDTLMNAIRAIPIPGRDDAALRTAISGVLTEAPPSGRRIPDRSLVQGLTGEGAADQEIEAGQFQVVTPDNKWTVVLDIEAADIVLKEV